MKSTKTFTDYVKEGPPFDSFERFKVLNRVLNPQGANVWAKSQVSDQSKIWECYKPWSAGFGNEIKATSFLTDEDFVTVIDQIETAD